MKNQENPYILAKNCQNSVAYVNAGQNANFQWHFNQDFLLAHSFHHGAIVIKGSNLLVRARSFLRQE